MASEETSPVRWFYYALNDRFRGFLDGWYPFDEELHPTVEHLYREYEHQQNVNPVVTAANGHQYELNFETMTQRNTTFGRERPIARSTNGLPPETVPDLASIPNNAQPTVVASMAAAFTFQQSLTSVTLTDLLKTNNKSLWKFKLHKETHFDNLDQFCEALQQNTTVTSVQITWRFLRHVRNPTRLLESLGALTNLEDLALEVVGPTSLIASALQHATKLTSLRIGKIRFASTQQVQELALALQGCQSLRRFDLASVQAVVEGMEGMLFLAPRNHDPNQPPVLEEDSNKICLEPLLDSLARLPQLVYLRLQHYLRGKRVQAPCEASLRSLCQAPRQSLILHSCGLTDEQCAVLADELKQSSPSLSVLVVTRNPNISPLGWQSLVDMLAVNHSILDFHHGEDGQGSAPSPEQLTKISYYLDLNHAGRGKLLRGSMSARRQAWMDFVVQGREDLDRLFFALQVDPSLYITPELVA